MTKNNRMSTQKRNPGFTLIELLVVVSIIGILSTVAIASLSTARARGADAAVKANLANIRSQAEIYYETNNFSFGTDSTGNSQCTVTSTGVTSAVGVFNDSVIKTALHQVWINSDNSASGFAITCGIGGNGQRWAIRTSHLKGGGNWCVDNSGWNGPGTLVLNTGRCS